MAVRVNSKFVVILLGATMCAAATIGGLWYLQWRGDVTRNLRAGDEYMALEEYLLAAQHYGRAVSKQPANLGHIVKMREALSRARPETHVDALQAYHEWVGTLTHEAYYNSDDPDAHLRLIAELYGRTRMLSLVLPTGAPRERWEEVATAAQSMLDRLPESEPKRVYGKLYRGLARVRQHALISPDQLASAERDLHEFVEAMPGHDFGWAALLHSTSVIAEHLRFSGQPRRAEEKNRELADLVARAVQQVPDGLEVHSVSVRHMAVQRAAGADVSLASIEEAAQRLAERARDLDDPWLLVEIAEIVQIVGGAAGVPLALELYAGFLDRNPDALAHRYFKARIQHRTGDLDGARASADEVIEGSPIPVSFVAQMRRDLRQLAASLIVDVEYDRWSNADQEAQAALAPAVFAARDRLERLGAKTEDYNLTRADAKVALVKEDYQTAAAKLERLIREGASDLETLVHSSTALERIGQIGVAHERIVTAVENPRAAPWLIHRQGWLEYRMGRLNEAASTLADYLSRVPDDDGARDLLQVIQRRLAGAGGAPSDTGGDAVILALEAAQRTALAGDIDTARATLRSAIEARRAAGDEDDVRLLSAAARLEMAAGQTEEAKPLVERALEIRPNDTVLLHFKTVLETGDVVAAARQFVEAAYADPAERAVQLVMSLNSLAAEEQRRANDFEQRGDPERAARARDGADRAAAARDAEILRIRNASAGSDVAAARNHPQFLDIEFTRALEAKAWDQAEHLANRARELDADQVRGLMYRGRLAFERGNFEAAVRAFQQATEQMSFNSLPWRGLALSYMRLGNFREAQRAFEQAYRANPNDVVTVRQYLGLLAQMREHARAAQIALAAHRFMPHDVTLRELWLDLEYQQGKTAQVVTERRNIRERSPHERRNLLRLAMLLASADPTYELIMDSGGNRTYSERAWRQLGAADQRRQLQQLRERWAVEAAAIVDEVERREGADMELVALRALLLRLRGDAAAGERVLKAYLESHDEADQTADMHILLSQYYQEIGNMPAAMSSLRDAIARQGATGRGDLAMGHLLFTRSGFRQAAEHFERALAASPDRQVAVRLAECYARSGQFARAEETVNTILAEGEMDYLVAMLQALIAQGQGSELLAAGREAEAGRKFEANLEALATAERLMPSDPTPHLLRVQSLLQQFGHTQRRSLLEDALATLQRAEMVRPDDVRIALARTEVQRAMGNTRTAVAELARAVQRTPDSIELRRRLVQLQLEMEDRSAAMATVSQAVEMYPHLAIWHEMQGNLHAMNSSNLVAAATSFRRAYEIGRSPVVLGRYIAVLLAGDRPDYATAASVLGGERAHVDAEPELGALYAMTLMKSGRSERGLQEMARSHRQLREMIASGERTVADINSWFNALHPLFSEQPPALVEQAIRDLTDGKPLPIEMQRLAMYWSERGASGLDRASELLREALGGLEPDDRDSTIRLNLELGRYHLLAEQYAASLAAFERILEMEPDHPIALNNAAFVMSENLDRPREALPRARRAADLAPQSAQILDTLGTVHYRLGEHGKAREVLLRSLAIEESAATLFHLARVLVAEGDLDAARSRLERATELRPGAKTQAEISRLADDIRTGGGRSR